MKAKNNFDGQRKVASSPLAHMAVGTRGIQSMLRGDSAATKSVPRLGKKANTEIKHVLIKL